MVLERGGVDEARLAAHLALEHHVARHARLPVVLHEVRQLQLLLAHGARHRLVVVGLGGAGIGVAVGVVVGLGLPPPVLPLLAQVLLPHVRRQRLFVLGLERATGLLEKEEGRTDRK